MKRTFKAAEVCKQLDLPPYVLRYWETEFPMLQGKGNGPARTFSADEVATLRRIQQLLYEEGYTIAGAKKKLEGEPAGHAAASPSLFAEAAPPAATASGDGPLAPAALDSPPEERIETLRNGIAAALAEARSILELLGKPGR